MTRLEHIYAIKNILSRGAASDDFRISNAEIYHHLKVARALLLKRKLDKHHNITDLNFITICVPLEEATYHDCSCIDADFDCKVLKSRCALPTDLVARWGTSLQVKDLSGNIISPISRTSSRLAKWSLSNKDIKIGWDIENKKLVIFNNLRLEYVLVKGIWQDPAELVNYCGCDGTDSTLPCYTADADFPIDAELIQPMYDLVIQRLASSFTFPEDRLNDAKDVQTAPAKA